MNLLWYFYEKDVLRQRFTSNTDKRGINVSHTIYLIRQHICFLCNSHWWSFSSKEMIPHFFQSDCSQSFQGLFVLISHCIFKAFSLRNSKKKCSKIIIRIHYLFFLCALKLLSEEILIGWYLQMFSLKQIFYSEMTEGIRHYSDPYFLIFP